MGDERTRYKIELKLNDFNKKIILPCGVYCDISALLEDIWQQTGCDIEKESGHWVCSHCNKKYFFYLY